MTDDATIWNALRVCVPRKKWMPVREIVATVRGRLVLDPEDLELRGSPSGLPRWESNVRRLLRAKSQSGSIRSRKRGKAT